MQIYDIYKQAWTLSLRSMWIFSQYNNVIAQRNALQEHYGVTTTALIDDPNGVTVEGLALEIIVSTKTQDKHVSSMTSTWISPSPVSIRLRLYCLPYAGGISENVYARQALDPSHLLNSKAFVQGSNKA